jgi:hypothetical protein
MYCNTHKTPGMITFKKTCLECNKTPCYGNVGEKGAFYCAVHKKEGMINVTHKTCKTYLCTVVVKKKYDGYCFFCFINLFPNKKVSCNYRTKEYSTIEFLKNKFPDVNWITDKTLIDGCSRRRPDVLLDLGYQIIIVEIDENQHIAYDTSCENKRMMELSKDADIGQ